jgi:putative membrane protein
MIKALLRTALSLVILSWLLPTVDLPSITTLILASIVVSLLFGLVKPVLQLLFLPINFVTLGLFSSLLNAFLLWIAMYLVPGFIIEPMSIFGVNLSQFWTLVLVSFLLGFVQSLIKVVI